MNEIKLEEIMDMQATTLYEQTTLEEIVLLVTKTKASDFPVVDTNYNFRGMVYERDLLKAIYKDVKAQTAEDLKNTPNLKNLNAEMHKITAGSIMTTAVKTFAGEEPAVRAGAVLLFENLHIAPVVQGSRLVGMITQTRIFSEIIRQFESQWTPRDTAEAGERREGHDAGGGANKRFFKRIELKVPLAYKVIKTPQGEAIVASGKIGSTIDMSAGGLMALVQDNLPLGTVIQAALDLYQNDQPLKILCRVVRCVPHKNEEGFFQLGLMFLSINPEERRKMYRYVERLASGQPQDPNDQNPKK